MQVITPWAIANRVTPYQVGGRGARVNKTMFLKQGNIVFECNIFTI